MTTHQGPATNISLLALKIHSRDGTIMKIQKADEQPQGRVMTYEEAAQRLQTRPK